MIGVHLDQGRITVKEFSTPPRPGGFALIRLLTAGICSTDLELQRGYYGFSGIPGHEFVGEVLEADTPALIGQRVVGEINLACEKCDWCARSLGRHCPHRTVLGIVKHPGAFAEYLTLPEINLHPIPHEIPTEHAVFLEPLAAACEILDQVTIAPDHRVAVLGDGKLGLLVSQVLKTTGAEVVQYGRHPEKLKIAATRNVDTRPATNLPRHEYDFVVDATGSQEGLKHAVSLVKPRGTVILKSTVHGEAAIDTAPVIVNEITLVGSRCGRFEPALDLLRTGKINLPPMLSGSFPLEEAPRAFEEAAKHGVLKVLLRNDG